MCNLKQDIEAVLDDEWPHGIVVGDGKSGYHHPPDTVPEDRIGKLVGWDEAAQWLDYHYDDGLGCVECHPVTLWTDTRIIFVQTYDGDTKVRWLPRHPRERHMPYFAGDTRDL